MFTPNNYMITSFSLKLHEKYVATWRVPAESERINMVGIGVDVYFLRKVYRMFNYFETRAVNYWTVLNVMLKVIFYHCIKILKMIQ